MLTWCIIVGMSATVIHVSNGPAAPAATFPSPSPGEPTAIDRAGVALAKHARPITEKERRCAELFVLYNSQIRAYREAYEVHTGESRTADYNHACHILHRPHVLAYIRELRSANARAVGIDVQALIASDRAIVEAADHARSITWHEWHACRWCNGVAHAYQWRDPNEFAEATARWFEATAVQEAREIKPAPMPDDSGGYGFTNGAEPSITCPQCEGRGVQHTLVADTDKLGAAAPLYKGMKVTKNGIEVLLHDVDKAKDRLYRATGSYGDDAASVARGAAAGAAAGGAAAAALATQVANMSADEARKAYLTLINP